MLHILERMMVSPVVSFKFNLSSGSVVVAELVEFTRLRCSISQSGVSQILFAV